MYFAVFGMYLCCFLMNLDSVKTHLDYIIHEESKTVEIIALAYIPNEHTRLYDQCCNTISFDVARDF